jgi:hypothetical protein
VAQPQVDPAMRTGVVAALVLLLACAGVFAVAGTGVAAANLTSASSAVVGNVTGPVVLGYDANQSYMLQASGGPAFAANGTQVGNLTFFATLSGSNLTGDTISPSTGTFASGLPENATVTVGNITETLTIQVEITSVYLTANVSLNLTYSVSVVQPYVLTLDLIADSNSAVAAFTLTVDLDGAPVGTIHIPALSANEAYAATFQYASLGLSAGEHTFTVSLANEHGLVTFAGGASTYSTSFYVAGAAPDYTLWYVAGAVAFFGAIFIFVTRVAARRRSPSKK